MATMYQAVVVAKKMFVEYGNLVWFDGTRLYKDVSGFSVKILVDPKYINNIIHLIDENLVEDGVLVTFFPSNLRKQYVKNEEVV